VSLLASSGKLSNESTASREHQQLSSQLRSAAIQVVHNNASQAVSELHRAAGVSREIPPLLPQRQCAPPELQLN